MVAIEKARLRLGRQLLGENQAQFAQRCGISAGYLSLIESGHRPTVSPAVFARICDALGVTDRTQLMADEPVARAS